jgi:hypothetical protein
MDAHDLPRLYFLPADLDFSALPAELQAAASSIIGPAYEQLVLGARDGLEKSTGVTIVHLLWLEVLDQFELGQQLDEQGRATPSAERGELIAQHLRLVGAKGKASNLLLRLREFRRKWQPFPLHQAVAPTATYPASDPGPPQKDSG